MPTSDQLKAFIATVEHGSFSAAARQLGKAQSTISNAVINLEIETGIELFDRSERNPQLSTAGRALLADASNVLRSQDEFDAHASYLHSQPETHLCLAIEQSVWSSALLPVLEEFERLFPYVTLELLDPGSSDVGELIRDDRADFGMMFAQEVSPRGFRFQGIGYSRLLTVCSPDHALVEHQPVDLVQLRQYRQLEIHSRYPNQSGNESRRHSPRYWLLESPYVAIDLVARGLGWAILNQAVVAEKLTNGDIVSLQLSFEKTEMLQGVDIVWSESRQPGKAGHWMLERLLSLTVDDLG